MEAATIAVAILALVWAAGWGVFEFRQRKNGDASSAEEATVQAKRAADAAERSARAAEESALTAKAALDLELDKRREATNVARVKWKAPDGTPLETDWVPVSKQ